MGRTLSARQVLSVRNASITLGGEWGRCVGTMNRHGVVFFWGQSGNGKTTAVVSFCPKARAAMMEVATMPTALQVA